MRSGGTLNTRVFQNDLTEIQSGQIYSSTLIRLPLSNTFHEPTAAAGTYHGARPDLATDSGRNPIVGNVAGGAQITPVRIPIQEPANCLQLLWHALDPGGNYECSYPLNSNLNRDPPSGAYPATFATGVAPHWAFGWLRINGLGPWFPMSLLKANDVINTSNDLAFTAVFPFNGFSSVCAPMSFVDWVGYWDGVGTVNQGPMGQNAYILAVTSVNTSLSSNGNTLGTVINYATPSGSGPEQNPANTDIQRNQDVLVRSGNGRS